MSKPGDLLKPSDSDDSTKVTLRPVSDSASSGLASVDVYALPLPRDPDVDRDVEEQTLAPPSDGSAGDDDAAPFSLRMPASLQCYAAEAAGMGVMITIGLITNIQSTLTGDPENPTKSNDVSYAFGWGVGLFAGLLITIPVSGGHINPAITLMLASFRGFPWRKVPGYWTAQITGAFIAASVVQGLYYQLLDQYEGGRGLRTWKTATLFIDVASAWESDIDAFFQEITGAALLLLGVAIATDPTNAHWTTWSKALIMLWFFVGISGCMGLHPGYALNPARDFGVRLSCWAFGYGTGLWTERRWYWIWGCLIAPLTGGWLTTFLHDFIVRGRAEFTVPLVTRALRRRKRKAM